MRTVEAPKCTPRVKRIAGIWECRADQISAKAYVDMAALELIHVRTPRGLRGWHVRKELTAKDRNRSWVA
jgi:hypothetical protein